MRRRTLLAAILASGTAAATSACSSSTSNSSASSSTGASSSSVSVDGDTLVVYTNSNDSGRAEWVTAQAKDAGIKIQIVGAGGGDTTNKIIAEKGRPVADVVYGLNNMYFEQLKAASVLDKVTPAWASAVQSTSDKDGYYYPLVEQGIVLISRKGTQQPSDWTDLWSKPAFAKRYQSETGLGGATTQLVFAGLLTRYLDPNGKLGVSQQGWDQIKGYFDKGSPAVEGKELFARLADKSVDAGQMYTSGILKKEKQFAVDVDIARPSVGVPYAVEQIGLVAGSKKADLAKKFIDWFGSPKVQGAFAQQFNSVPVHPDARKLANPDALALVKDLKHQDIDWAVAQKYMPDWIKTIELEYLK